MQNPWDQRQLSANACKTSGTNANFSTNAEREVGGDYAATRHYSDLTGALRRLSEPARHRAKTALDLKNVDFDLAAALGGDEVPSTSQSKQTPAADRPTPVRGPSLAKRRRRPSEIQAPNRHSALAAAKKEVGRGWAPYGGGDISYGASDALDRRNGTYAPLERSNEDPPAPSRRRRRLTPAPGGRPGRSQNSWDWRIEQGTGPELVQIAQSALDVADGAAVASRQG